MVTGGAFGYPARGGDDDGGERTLEVKECKPKEVGRCGPTQAQAGCTCQAKGRMALKNREQYTIHEERDRRRLSLKAESESGCSNRITNRRHSRLSKPLFGSLASLGASSSSPSCSRLARPCVVCAWTLNLGSPQTG